MLITTAAGGAPDAVAVSPDGSSVYLAGAMSRRLFAIDATTGHLQVSVPAGSGATGVAVS